MNDDLAKQMNKLQLITGGRVSQTLALKAVGLDWKRAVRRMMEDQRFEAARRAQDAANGTA